jgi:type IV pilus biogenesis protein CpaD/CtpE
MSRQRTALVASCLAILALPGCKNPDAPIANHNTPQAQGPANAGEPTSPAPPSPASQAPTDVQSEPERALAAFAERYANWSYRTLTADQRTLAAISVGAARLTEQQAAARSQADSTIARGRIENRGRVISIARNLASGTQWVIVTREQTSGNSEYEGLGASYHVTIAALAAVPGGYAVSQWLPQS